MVVGQFKSSGYNANKKDWPLDHFALQIASQYNQL